MISKHYDQHAAEVYIDQRRLSIFLDYFLTRIPIITLLIRLGSRDMITIQSYFFDLIYWNSTLYSQWWSIEGEEEEIGRNHKFTLPLEDLEKWNWQRSLAWQYHCLFCFPIVPLGGILIFGEVALVMFILKKENKVTPSLFFLVEYLGPKHKILVTVCPPRTYARTAGKTHLVKSLKQNLHFQKGPKKDPDFLSVAVIRFYWSINFQCWASLFLF